MKKTIEIDSKTKALLNRIHKRDGTSYDDIITEALEHSIVIDAETKTLLDEHIKQLRQKGTPSNYNTVITTALKIVENSGGNWALVCELR